MAASISQGLMGQALVPKLSATGSVPTASQEASYEPRDYLPEGLPDYLYEEGTLPGLSSEMIQILKNSGFTDQDILVFDQQSRTGYGNFIKSKDKSVELTPDNYVAYMQSLASKGNKDAIDWLVNYYSTWEANKWAAERDDTAYQRLNKDLMAAGISPYVLSGATPQISSVKMPNSSSFADTEKNKRSKESTDRGNVLQMIGYGLLTAGRIIAALL